MKIYKVVDNTEVVIVTTDRLKALEAVYLLVQKYAEKQTWFWVDEDEIQ